MNTENTDHQVLIVPGYNGSGEAHWQSWLEARLPNASRVRRIDWSQPVLSVWAGEVRREIQQARKPIWIVAHSFGCLATAVAVSDRPEKVLGVVLVAPADPQRFHLLGCYGDQTPDAASSRDLIPVTRVLPLRPLDVDGVVISSENDPWLSAEGATSLASSWGLRVHSAGRAGHINVESGYGPWPWLLDELNRLQQARADACDRIVMDARLPRGRGSVLAHIRQLTRQQMDRHIF
ncbi:MAG TPA: alpha/beta hydrolase [Pseudohongiella sp.]|nr:alpha/beta hydrolase [Pseudohongiella sp.]